jgi:hypothetical protein
MENENPDASEIITEKIRSIDDVGDYELNEPLLELMEAAADDEILMFTYMGDEREFAYAFTGEVLDVYYGTLWFISRDGVVPIEIPRHNNRSVTEYFWSIDGAFVLDSQKFIVLELYFTTGSSSLVFGIKDNNWYMYDELIYGGNIRVIDEDTIYIFHSTFDAGFDKTDGFGTGRTGKWYYLYWNNGFREYGGIEITESQFLLFNGADIILNEMRANEYVVREIIYRANGIININYGREDDSWQSNYYLEIRYNGNSVVINSDGDGYYLAALSDEIAVYPEFIPPIAYEPW